MGGCFAIVAQGQLGTFDGVGILGYSGIHTVVPTRPGQPEAVWPWISRQSSLDNPKILNGAALEASEGPTLGDHAAISEARSEEHTSELQSLMRISYAVFCLKKKIRKTQTHKHI